MNENASMHFVVLLSHGDRANIYVDGKNMRAGPGKSLVALGHDLADQHNTELQVCEVDQATFEKPDFNLMQATGQIKSIVATPMTESEEVSRNLIKGEEADIWYDAGEFDDTLKEERIRITRQAMRLAAGLVVKLTRERNNAEQREYEVLGRANALEAKLAALQAASNGDVAHVPRVLVVIDEQGNCGFDQDSGVEVVIFERNNPSEIPTHFTDLAEAFDDLPIADEASLPIGVAS